MIQQLSLILLFFFLGWVHTSSWLLNGKHQILITPISLFLGTAIYSFILFGLLNLQSFTSWSIEVTFIISNVLTLLMICLLAIRNRKFIRLYKQKDFYYFASFILLIIGGSYLFTKFNYSFATEDSHFFLHFGEGLALIGFKVDSNYINSYDFSGFAPFYPMYHSLSRVLNVDYLWLFGPTYAVVFIVSFFLILKAILEDILFSNLQSSLLALLTILIILVSRFFIVNAVYINNHIFTSIHFSLFFLVGLIALNTKSEVFTLIAMIILLPCVLMRMENGVLLLVFSLLFASQTTSLLMAQKIIFLSGLTVFLYSISCLIAMPPNETTLYISFSRMILSSIGGLCFFLFGLSINNWVWMAKNWNKFKTHLPYLIILLTSIVISYSFIFQSDLTIWSVVYMFYNIFDIQIWNHFWFFIIFMFVISIFLPSRIQYKNQIFIVTGIVFFLLYTIELAYLRGIPYREGFGDSANRMLIHIVPLIVAHFTIYFASCFKKPCEQSHGID